MWMYGIIGLFVVSGVYALLCFWAQWLETQREVLKLKSRMNLLARDLEIVKQKQEQ